MNEYWYNDFVYVQLHANERISVTLFYGASRQYAIKTSDKLEINREKQIKSLLKKLRSEKKYVTPMHGTTNCI